MTGDAPRDMSEIERVGAERFPGLLGIEVLEVERGRATMRIELGPRHMAPNGYLHAGVIVGLADSACGYGCMATLPEGAVNFATLEVKTNFLGTATGGTIECTASMIHGGRTTQVWDAAVSAGGKTIALFRCTQLVLYPD